ncbi:6455_t:CDS:2, partial [Scutellospora calospora]
RVDPRSNIPADNIIQMFLGGLKGENAKFVTILSPVTLDEAIEGARKAELGEYFGRYAKGEKEKPRFTLAKYSVGTSETNLICFRCKEVSHVSRGLQDEYRYESKTTQIRRMRQHCNNNVDSPDEATLR